MGLLDSPLAILREWLNMCDCKNKHKKSCPLHPDFENDKRLKQTQMQLKYVAEDLKEFNFNEIELDQILNWINKEAS